MDPEKKETTPPKESQNNNSISRGISPKDGVAPVPGENKAPSPLVYVRRRVEVDTSKDQQPKEPPTKQGPKLDWEERYHQLQLLLNKLNDSDQTDHLQMLWSLSSAELSKHAVDLEKRSIQLSLEEAREMQRVAALNVLGRSVNSLKSTSNDRE